MYGDEQLLKDLHRTAQLIGHKGAKVTRVDTDEMEIHFTDPIRQVSGYIGPVERTPGFWLWVGDVHTRDSFRAGPIGRGRYLKFNPYPSWVARAYLWDAGNRYTLPRKNHGR